jgi:hypothetical protein
MNKNKKVDFMAGFKLIEERDGVARHPESIASAKKPSDVSNDKKYTNVQNSRVGKVAITSWHDPAVRKQLAQIALDFDKDQSDLIVEGINLVFEKYGRSPIAK